MRRRSTDLQCPRMDGKPPCCFSRPITREDSLDGRPVVILEVVGMFLVDEAIRTDLGSQPLTAFPIQRIRAEMEDPTRILFLGNLPSHVHGGSIHMTLEIKGFIEPDVDTLCVRMPTRCGTDFYARRDWADVFRGK
jgi:hypothetical protein